MFLSNLFNKVVGFYRSKIYYNPTDLPNWAIDRLCEISKSKDDDYFELGIHAYRSYLTDIGFELPPFRQILDAANEGRLKEILADNVNSDYKISMFADNVDSDAICIYPDMESFYKAEAEKRENALNNFLNSPEAKQNRLNAYNDKGEFCAFRNLKVG